MMILDNEVVKMLNDFIFNVIAAHKEGTATDAELQAMAAVVAAFSRG